MSLPILKRNVAGQVFPFVVYKNGLILTSVPLQAGDFVAFLDHVNMGNITVTEDPAASGVLKAAPSQAMTNGAVLVVKCHDQTAPAAWDDVTLIVPIDIITIGEALPASSYTAPPSAAAIDAQLSGTHGAGSWLSDGAAPTVDQIDAQLTASHGAGSWQEGPGAATIATQVDATLTASHGAGLWGGGAGTGVITFTYSLTYANPSPPPATLPIDGALVWVTTDALGTNRVAQGLTDAFGEVVFFLDPGTYYFWRAKDGFQFTNPDTEVVS